MVVSARRTHHQPDDADDYAKYNPPATSRKFAPHPPTPTSLTPRPIPSNPTRLLFSPLRGANERKKKKRKKTEEKVFVCVSVHARACVRVEDARHAPCSQRLLVADYGVIYSSRFNCNIAAYPPPAVISLHLHHFPPHHSARWRLQRACF